MVDDLASATRREGRGRADAAEPPRRALRNHPPTEVCQACRSTRLDSRCTANGWQLADNWLAIGCALAVHRTAIGCTVPLRGIPTPQPAIDVARCGSCVPYCFLGRLMNLPLERQHYGTSYSQSPPSHPGDRPK